MKFTTKNLVLMAALIALSVVFVQFIHFPVFPSAPYLEFDPADIPMLIGAFAFGPVAGLIIVVIAAGIQALTVSAQSGVYGFLMHVLATGTLVTAASVIYRIKHTRIGAVIGLATGTLAMAIVMMLANYFITPLFLGVPASAVTPMLLPVILPFNLIKAGVNSVITFIVYKAISKYIIHGDKFGKKGNSASQNI